jgi:hypothetical protein
LYVHDSPEKQKAVSNGKETASHGVRCLLSFPRPSLTPPLSQKERREARKSGGPGCFHHRPGSSPWMTGLAAMSKAVRQTGSEECQLIWLSSLQYLK